MKQNPGAPLDLSVYANGKPDLFSLPVFCHFKTQEPDHVPASG